MRLLVNVDDLASIGGVELSSLQVSERLAARGHVIDVLYARSGDLEPRWREIATLRQVQSFLITQQRFVQDTGPVLRGLGALRGLRPDVIWVNRVEHLLWGLLASRITRAPLVVHLRMNPHFPGVSVLGRGASHFIAVSGVVRRLWTDAGLRPDQVSVVHNGVDPADYPYADASAMAGARRSLGLGESGPVVLYYGRWHPEKGLEQLLRAWRGFAVEGPAQLVVAGDPYPTAEGAAYAARVRELADDRVTFLPMQSDVVPLLHAADLTILPSQLEEPFGRVVAETLSTGRPVLASRIGGIPEQLTGPFTELLFEPTDTAGLTALLTRFADWRRTDPELGVRCAAHAAQSLSLTSTVDGVERVLAAAVAKRHRARHRSR